MCLKNLPLHWSSDSNDYFLIWPKSNYLSNKQLKLFNNSNSLKMLRNNKEDIFKLIEGVLRYDTRGASWSPGCIFMYPQFDFGLSTLEVSRFKKIWSFGLPSGQLVAMVTNFFNYLFELLNCFWRCLGHVVSMRKI